MNHTAISRFATSTVTPAKRVAIYARVSTTRQAEQDLSLPDQIAQAEGYCQGKGWEVLECFVEAGASATYDRRPEFQKLIDKATGADRPLDTILVHSMSRFFRDQFQSEFYIRKLRKVGVEVVSITQPFENDSTGNLMRQFLGLFDEYQSKENGKHTLRAMRENARQDFWNGARIPFGYFVEEAERRGVKAKKRLMILEPEAAVVKGIFDLAIGRHGPAFGVKAIVNRLNAEGTSFRGKKFQISSIYRILTSRTYMGEHFYNKRFGKTGEEKPREEWIVSSVPAIISPEDFERIHASLAVRNPKVNPPRVVNGPTLLTGLARCGTCNSGMTIRTGKSGRYRYYTCAGCAQKGKSHCAGRSISMPKLDDVVLDHLANRLFKPDRLKVILEAYVAQSTDAQGERSRRLATARQRQTEISGKISRLMQMVANGLTEGDDPDLANQVQGLKAQRGQAMQEVTILAQTASSAANVITDDRLASFSAAISEAIASPDPAFRKAYLRLFVDSVVVGDSEIAISGPKAALAKAATFSALPPASEMVPSFIRAWRPVGDSNPCRRRERAVSWASRRTGRGVERNRAGNKLIQAADKIYFEITLRRQW